METRKLQLVGARSYSVSLPKDWVVNQGLDKQSTVYIQQTPNHALLIKAQDTKESLHQLTIPLSEIENIQEFLVLCYVKNIDYITLTAKKITYEQAKDIKHIVEYLEGYDITSEDETHITISFLFKEVTIHLEDIQRRTTYIITLMLEALNKQDRPTLYSLEKEVDRLYHLSKRILFACTRSTKTREDNNVTDVENLFFHNMIFKKLENIADTLLLVEHNQQHTLTHAITLLRKLFIKKHRPTTLLKELREGETARNEHARHVQDLVQDVLENATSLHYSKRYFSHNI